MRYLVGYHILCGCVTAAMAASDATDKEIATFVRSMIETGRAVRPSDETTVTLSGCPHRRALTVPGDA